MSLLSHLHSKLNLGAAEKIIQAYATKQEYNLVRYEKDAVIHYSEKIAGLRIPFKVTFCRQKFATIDAGTETVPAAAASFTQLQAAYEALKHEAETPYGPPYSTKADCESYEDLLGLNLRASMTSGLPNDRYLAVRESIWKIGTDAANLNLVYDYFDNLCLSFYYTVKDAFG